MIPWTCLSILTIIVVTVKEIESKILLVTTLVTT